MFRNERILRTEFPVSCQLFRMLSDFLKMLRLITEEKYQVRQIWLALLRILVLMVSFRHTRNYNTAKYITVG